MCTSRSAPDYNARGRAIAAGELVRCDTRGLARALEATLTGSMLAWTFSRQGTLANWLRRDLRAVIAPYETP
jgi:hypothetical protein